MRSFVRSNVLRFVPFLVFAIAASCGGAVGQTREVTPMTSPSSPPAASSASSSGTDSPAPEGAGAVCGPQASPRDAAGALIGSTRDSTTIRVQAPIEIRAATEIALPWHMAGGVTAPLTVYGQHPDGSRLDPRSIDAINQDDYLVKILFPKAGCWRLHSERANGKLSGDLWLDVLPAH